MIDCVAMDIASIKISPVNMTERKNLRIRSGDTVRVWQKIKEGEKFRLQAFEGLVIACKHGTEAGGTFTVHKVMGGVGVEKIFPLYSPMIDKVEFVKRSKVQRAKLYHIKEKSAKDVRREMRNIQTLPDMEEVIEAKEEGLKEEVKAEESAPKKEKK
ncbi:MAG: 50S ribosomal protein L19 [Patescibacteria group bacterium]